RQGSALAPHTLVDPSRIGVPTRRFHRLTDEPADRLRIGLRVGDLVRVLGDDLVHHLLDRREVGHLLHAAGVHDRVRIAALVPYNLEQILGDLAGDRAGRDQIEDRTELRRRYRRGGDVLVL